MADPKKILIIQLKRAGDVLLTTPIPTLLKRRWPAARVDFLVDRAFAPLLEQHPAIDAVQIYQRNAKLQTLRRLRAERYDLIFDFQSFKITFRRGMVAVKSPPSTKISAMAGPLSSFVRKTRSIRVRWSVSVLALTVISTLEPMRETYTFGQINMFLVLLVLLDLLVLVPRQSKWAGIGIGIAAAIKLTPAIFIVYHSLRFRDMSSEAFLTNLRVPLLNVQRTKLSSLPLKRTVR